MRLLYDATPLLMRSAGVKNYHHALLRRLIYCIRPHNIELFPFLRVLTPNHNERSNYPPAATAMRLGAVLASNYLRLPVASRAAARADVFHVTHHLRNVPRCHRLTSMLHDPTPITMPEQHTLSNVRYFEGFVRKTLPQLDAVITPSEAVRSDVAQRLGYPAERVRAIPHGVDEDFFDATPAAKQTARGTYDLPASYTLFVGSVEPRKNLVRLVEAFALLPESLRREYPLVITGASGWKNAKIQSAIRRAKHVSLVGYVSRELLPAVYHMSSLFVFPSLYEGFGMPLLEAMAAGVPTLTSNVSALPEVAGDAALLVDPLDVEQIADGMSRLLTDRQYAATLGERARARARLFTWELCAERTKAFFEDVA